MNHHLINNLIAEAYPEATRWDHEFRFACLTGQIKIAEAILEVQVDDPNLGLLGACEGGYMELAKFTIKQGAEDWDNGLVVASLAGQVELAKFMIECGATMLDNGLYEAVKYRVINIIPELIKLGANVNIALAGACFGGHRDLAGVFVRLGANDWNLGLINACENGQVEMARFMLEKGAISTDEALRCAIEGNYRDVVMLLINHGANIDHYCKFIKLIDNHTDMKCERVSRQKREDDNNKPLSDTQSLINIKNKK